MRLPGIVAAFSAGVAASACHKNRVDTPQSAEKTAERSIFTDSVMHAQQCEPVRPGENWRIVCVPKDQRLEIRRKP